MAKTRNDLYFPPQPVEGIRYMFTNAVSQALQGEPIVIHLPPAAEHADMVVNQAKPMHVTTISEGNVG